MRQKKLLAGSAENGPFDATHVKKPRLSLEAKILRLVRRYRAAERRRQKGQTTSSKQLLKASKSPMVHQRLTLDARSTRTFERRPRVYSANTLAWKASAAVMPMPSGFVAGASSSRTDISALAGWDSLLQGNVSSLN